MSELIPNGSSITESMISDWRTRFGATRSEAIAALDDIESGRTQAPEGLPRSTYAAVLVKNEGQSIRQKAFGVIKQAANAAAGGIIAGLVILGGIRAATGVFNTVTAGQIYATSTGQSIAASGTAAFTNVTISGTCTGCGGGGSFTGSSFVATTTVNLDLGTVALNNCSETSAITVTGTQKGDFVFVAWPDEIFAGASNGITPSAYASGTNSVFIKRCNSRGSTSPDPAPGNFYIEVRRP